MADAAEPLRGQLEQRVAGYDLRRVLCSAQGAVAYDAVELDRGTGVTLITVPMPSNVALPDLDWLSASTFTCFPPLEKLVRNAGEVYLVVAAVEGESLGRVLARDGPFAPAAAARLLLQLLRDLEQAGDAHRLYRALSAAADWLLLRRDPHGDWECRVLPVGLLDSSTASEVEEGDRSTLRELDVLGVLLGTLVGQANIVASRELASIVERLLDAPPQQRFHSRRELMAALTPLARAVSGPAPIVRDLPPRFDEEVQVTVFRPKSIVSGRWYRLLAFVHLAERRPGEDSLDPIAEVRRLARAALGEQITAYRSATEDSLAGLPEGGQINLVPEVEGIEFNPPSRSFAWCTDVHDESFQLRAQAGRAGTTLRGRLSAYLGSVLLAEVGMAFKLQKSDATDADPLAQERGRAYRKIFASYSHADARIVSDFEAVVSAFGDRYLIDVKDLRAGEIWSQALERLIDQADVFQLFWSSRSRASEFCRREWEYALEKGVNIRPVYWERPMPDPPDTLKRLHFSAFGGAGTAPAAPPAADADRLPASERLARLGSKLLAPVVAISALLLWVGLQHRILPSATQATSSPETTPPTGTSFDRSRWRPPPPPELAERAEEQQAPQPARPGKSSGGGVSRSGSSASHRCDCPAGDPLCSCAPEASEKSTLSPADSVGRPVDGHTCFVTGASNAPLYPQLSGPLNREPPCQGRNLASYRLADLTPAQAKKALDNACSRVVLRECSRVQGP
ncbi:MAG TPA: toll/interleukin-1 receptor domain-containing protein [Polyangiaceae bacterium]|nr:toll/interleukin-1 receptor domain-containing protein [Polyangiaceae bacterium]